MDTIDIINQEITNIQALWHRLNDKITPLQESGMRDIASQLQKVMQDMNLLEKSVAQTSEDDIQRRLAEASTRIHTRYAKTFQRLAKE
ncbi:MAG: hypothetical protein DRR19_23650 [Candidatus Parabeggiatoa sp. nov. 1]|nr:MAG: hypothetical protein DRR19_23650 [Gammaproteobacteria bacterium]